MSSMLQRHAMLPGLDLPDEVQARLEVLEREQGILSGERIFSQRPDAYRAAVNLLARGHSIREVAAVTDLSVPSVMMIRRREGMSVLTAAQKSDLSATLADVARLSAEQARDRLAAGEKIPLDKLMLAGAIATDKAMLLAGEATQRIEHVVRDDDGDDWEAELKRARAAGRVIDIDADDTGIEAAPGAANAGPCLIPHAQVDPLPGEPVGDAAPVSTDGLSDVYRVQVVDAAHNAHSDTLRDTCSHGIGPAAPGTCAGEREDPEAGEGGVAVEEGGVVLRYIAPSGLLDKGGRHVGE